jgi:hypothetical protein
VDKHGVGHDDALYAMGNARWTRDPYDAGRERRQPPILFIGPSRAGVMLQVLAERMSPRGLRVFHVMVLRPETAERAGYYL